MTKKKFHQNTIAVRSGLCSDKETGSLIPSIQLSTTYELPGFNQKGDYDYSRTNNPTRNLLAEAITDMEKGAKGVVTNTGMSAILLVCQLLNYDDILVAPHDCYGGSYRLFTHLAQRGVFKLRIIDQNDADAWQKALLENPKIIWVETPSNPLLRVYDIADICEKAKTIDALVAVDNTFLSPILQQPLALGADIVVHSCTKFINGHSDIVSGAVVCKTQELGKDLAWRANCLGVTGSPFDSYMVLRGLRTLPIRMQTHEKNSHKVVELLTNHPAVSQVYYPGIAEHSEHEIAKKQQSGFGSLISFELTGDENTIDIFIKSLNIFTQAQSLGGVESLINHPWTMTHYAMPDEAKKNAGISMGLLRLSVGVEAIEDLLFDLQQSLDILMT